MAEPQYDAQEVELLRQTLMPLYGRYLTTEDVIAILKQVKAKPGASASTWYQQIIAAATTTPSPTTPPATSTPAATRTATGTKTATSIPSGRQATPTGPPSTQTVTTTPTEPATVVASGAPTAPASATRVATPPPTATATSSYDPSIWGPVVVPTAIPGLRGGDGYQAPPATSVPTATRTPTATPSVVAAPTAGTPQGAQNVGRKSSVYIPSQTINTDDPTDTKSSTQAGTDPSEFSPGVPTFPMSTIPIGTIPTSPYVTDTSTYQFTADNVPGALKPTLFTDENWSGSLDPNYQDDYKLSQEEAARSGGTLGGDLWGNGDLTIGDNYYAAAAADDVLSNPGALTSAILDGYGMGNTPTNQALYQNAVANANTLFELQYLAGQMFTGDTNAGAYLPENAMNNQALGDFATDVLRSQQARGGGIDPYAVWDMYFNAGANPDSVGSQTLYGSTVEEQAQYAYAALVNAAGVNMNPVMRNLLTQLIPALATQYVASGGGTNFDNGFVEYLMTVPMIQNILGR